MLRCKSKVKSQKAKVKRHEIKRAFFYLLTFTFLLGCGAACRQDMQDQPKYVALRSSTFFRDGMSQRPLVEGTVPRGYLRADPLLYAGKLNLGQPGANPSLTPPGGTNAVAANMPGGQQSVGGAQNQSGKSNAQTGNAQSSNATSGANVSGSNTQGTSSAANMYGADAATVFPFPVTADLLNRGQERYGVFCAMCHGMTGDGDGLVVRRGFRCPPPYYTKQLREAPVGHFFDVITNGWGAMPSYNSQIPAQDRWAIIAYIRALQGTRTDQPTETWCQRNQSGGQR